MSIYATMKKKYILLFTIKFIFISDVVLDNNMRGKKRRIFTCQSDFALIYTVFGCLASHVEVCKHIGVQPRTTLSVLLI